MSGFQQKTGLFEYAVHQKKLTPRSFLAMFLSIISVFMVVYFLVTANCGTPVAIAHRLLFVLFIMILAFFLHPTNCVLQNMQYLQHQQLRQLFHNHQSQMFQA